MLPPRHKQIPDSSTGFSHTSRAHQSATHRRRNHIITRDKCLRHNIMQFHDTCDGFIFRLMTVRPAYNPCARMPRHHSTTRHILPHIFGHIYRSIFDDRTTSRIPAAFTHTPKRPRDTRDRLGVLRGWGVASLLLEGPTLGPDGQAF